MEVRYAVVAIEFLQTAIPATAPWNFLEVEDADDVCLNRHICNPDNTPDYITGVRISNDETEAAMQCCATRPGHRPRPLPMSEDNHAVWDMMANAYGFTMISQAEYDALMQTPEWGGDE